MSSFMLPEQTNEDQELLQAIAQTNMTPSQLEDKVTDYNKAIDEVLKICDTGRVPTMSHSSSAIGPGVLPGEKMDQAARGSSEEQRQYYDVALRQFELMAGRHQ